jgi:hypothetical protein
MKKKLQKEKNGERKLKIEKKKIKSFAFLWEADVDRSPSSFLCATKIKNKINIFFRLEIKVCCYKVTFEFYVKFHQQRRNL